jgi:hypothetical protein
MLQVRREQSMRWTPPFERSYAGDMIAVDKHGRVILPTTGITAKVYAQEKRDQGMAKDLSLDQPSGARIAAMPSQS